MLNAGEISVLLCCGIATLSVVIALRGFTRTFALYETAFPSFNAFPFFALIWFLGSSPPSPGSLPFPGSGSLFPAAAAAAISSSRVLISSRISPMFLASSMASVNSWPLNAWAFFPSSANLFLRSFFDIFINSSLVIVCSPFNLLTGPCVP